MSEWKKYYRSGSAEARPYVAGESLDGISVSAADAPAVGGMVFRNPDNHADMWYVAEDWFKKNYGDGGEIAALRARVRELDEALLFYADSDSRALRLDGGKIARAVLAGGWKGEDRG